MEVKAPDGYYAGDDCIKVVTNEDDGKTFAMEKTPGSELPETGGRGSAYIYILSAAFIITALVLYRRKKA